MTSNVRAFTYPQGSPAWLDLRTRRYGASETPQITGLSGKQTRVWRAKLGQPEEVDGLYIEMGHLLEPWALRLWARQMGRDVQPGPVLAEDGGWLLASLDGASDGEPVEAKFVGMGNPAYQAWTTETIPQAVDIQGRQQAMLSEGYLGRRIDAYHVTALILSGFGVAHHVYRIPLTAERREEWAEVYAPYPGQWHADYVLSRQPPPDATAQDVAVLVDTVSVTLREPREGETDLVAQLVAADAERARLAKVAREAEAVRDAIRSDLARRLGPDARIPGLLWKARKGLNPLLSLEK